MLSPAHIGLFPLIPSPPYWPRWWWLPELCVCGHSSVRCRVLLNIVMSPHCSYDWDTLTVLCIKHSLCFLASSLHPSLLFSSLFLLLWIQPRLFTSVHSGCSALLPWPAWQSAPWPGSLCPQLLLPSTPFTPLHRPATVFPCSRPCTGHFVCWVPCPGSWRDWILQSGLFWCAVQVPQPSLARYPSLMFAHISLSQPALFIRVFYCF